MKPLFAVAFLILLLGCSQKPKSRTPFIPREYELSLDRLREGVTTIFINPATGDSSIDNMWIVKNNNEEFIISVNYNNGNKQDSSIAGLDNGFYELYTWVGNGSLDTIPRKFIEEEYKRIDDGTKLGKEFVKRRLEREGFTLLMEGTQSYRKDTSMMIGDSIVNCIVTELNAKVRYESPFPIGDSLKKTRPHHSIIYYGKGLGTVKIIGAYGGSTFRWDLKEIRPLHRNN